MSYNKNMLLLYICIWDHLVIVLLPLLEGGGTRGMVAKQLALLPIVMVMVMEDGRVVVGEKKCSIFLCCCFNSSLRVTFAGSSDLAYWVATPVGSQQGGGRVEIS